MTIYLRELCRCGRSIGTDIPCPNKTVALKALNMSGWEYWRIYRVYRDRQYDVVDENLPNPRYRGTDMTRSDAVDDLSIYFEKADPKDSKV